MLPILEGVALIILFLSAFIWSKFVAGTGRTLSPFWFHRAVGRPCIAVLVIGALAFLASATPAIFTGIPQPCICDESSYLLAADTFAEGRLANPPHPFWKHFESLMAIQQPTYASKYPPAQGLALAFGQVFFGHPIVGVWLSVAMACAAICWMLCGWCPVRWAWTGGLVAVVRIAFSGPATVLWFDLGWQFKSDAYWSQSYWGGAMAALGGALVFGASPRIIKKQRPLAAFWLAAGLAILANSRPFEGLVATLPVMVILTVWCVRSREIGLRALFSNVLAPTVPVLFLTGLWMAFYNYRVTGNPLLLPFSVHQSTYDIMPIYLWQSLRTEPAYNHLIMRDFYANYLVNSYLIQRSFHGWILRAGWKILSLWFFYVGVLFTPFFVELRWMLRRRSVQFALATWALLVAALLAETWAMPHYAAPASSLAFLLVVESLRQAQLARWRGRRVGRFLVRAVLPLLLVSALTSFVLARVLVPSHWSWSVDRHEIERSLEQEGGKHLVIIRYGPKHPVIAEWVYNRADIDAAKVVWAREMDPLSNRKLIEYFKDRYIWLLEPDRIPRRLAPYPVHCPADG